MDLAVAEEHTTLRKTVVSGEKARGKLHASEDKSLPRKVVGERWAADGTPRLPNRCDRWAWVWQ